MHIYTNRGRWCVTFKYGWERIINHILLIISNCYWKIKCKKTPLKNRNTLLFKFMWTALRGGWTDCSWISRYSWSWRLKAGPRVHSGFNMNGSKCLTVMWQRFQELLAHVSTGTYHTDVTSPFHTKCQSTGGEQLSGLFMIYWLTVMFFSTSFLTLIASAHSENLINGFIYKITEPSSLNLEGFILKQRLTIVISVHLSEDFVCPFLWSRFILRHLHHWWHHLVNGLENAIKNTH